MNERTNGWMDGRKDEFMGEWMGKWMKWRAHYMVLTKEKAEMTAIGEALNVKGRQWTYNVIFNLFFLLVSSPCSKGIDLGILIDRSKSILKSNVQRLLKGFMPSFLQTFKISKKRTHIGVIMYDKSAKVLAPLNGPKSKNKGKAKAFIKNLDPSTATHTRTDKGLVCAYDQLFNRKKGDRSKRRNVLITFTDGRAWPRNRIRPFSKTVPPLKVCLLFSQSPF